MDLGLYTFADVGTDPVTGARTDPAERLRNLVEEIALAEEVGLDVFGLGEHHRPEYASSAPAVALAAAALGTRTIRLTSAVSVLSSDDPIRVFQQFATLDNLTDEKPRLVGVDHVALEVGDIEEALAFYGAIFRFELRGRGEGRAFIDMGDQFLALSEGRTQDPDAHRHVGLVVDDRGHVGSLAKAAGARLLDGPFLDFLDPWGNRIEVVEYRDLQFTKADRVLRAMGVPPDKSDKAREELRQKGLA